MKVLHVTNWYPNEWNTCEGIFVKEQMETFKEVTIPYLVNIQVRHSSNFFRLQYRRYSDFEEGYYFFTMFKSWRLNEIISTILLLYVLFKKKVNAFDALQVHIAYPLLSYVWFWKKFVKVPILISEHWTAYHFQFHLPSGSKGLRRIQRIFHQGIPVISVSEALNKDIYLFSGKATYPRFLLPNVVDASVYFPLQSRNRESSSVTFFVVNVWRPIKNPMPMLTAFASFFKEFPNVKLCIGGYGELLDSMKSFMVESGVGDSVRFLGKLSKEEIAYQLNNADAFLYSSHYETFSVACAQALFCGVPLIGPQIPAIMEYAGERDGIFFNQNSEENWVQAFRSFYERRSQYCRKSIANRAQERFSKSSIQQSYLSILKQNILPSTHA